MSADARAPGRRDGQATVELALALPVVMLLALLLVQVGLVVRAQLLVVHAARVGARTAAVDADDARVESAVRAATPLDPVSVDVVVVRTRGSPDVVRVEVRARVHTDVPLVGPLVGDVTVRAEATMPAESQETRRLRAARHGQSPSARIDLPHWI